MAKLSQFPILPHRMANWLPSLVGKMTVHKAADEGTHAIAVEKEVKGRRPLQERFMAKPL